MLVREIYGKVKESDTNSKQVEFGKKFYLKSVQTL